MSFVKRHRNSTKAALYRWQFTTSFFLLAFSTFQCKFTSTWLCAAYRLFTLFLNLYLPIPSTRYFLKDSIGTSSRSNSKRRFMKSQSLRIFLPRDENSVAWLRLCLLSTKVATKNRRRFFRGKRTDWKNPSNSRGRKFHIDRICLILEDAGILLH